MRSHPHPAPVPPALPEYDNSHSPCWQVFKPTAIVSADGSCVYSHAYPAVERTVRRLMTKPVQTFVDVSQTRSSGTTVLNREAIQLLDHNKQHVGAFMARMAALP